jgi:hypothetical protein
MLIRQQLASAVLGMVCIALTASAGIAAECQQENGVSGLSTFLLEISDF